LLDSQRNDLVGKRLLLFSYGSGSASTLFSIKVTKPNIKYIADTSNIQQRLASRVFVKPEEFTQILTQNEKRYESGKEGYTPTQSLSDLFPGTYYLSSIDTRYRRTYLRLPPTNYQSAKL